MKVPSLEQRMERCNKQQLDILELIEEEHQERRRLIDEVKQSANKKIAEIKAAASRRIEKWKSNYASIREDVRIYSLLTQVRDGKLALHNASTGEEFKVAFV